LDNFTRLDGIQRFIQELEYEVNQIPSEVRGLKKVIKTTRGRYRITWYHPLLFLKVVSWLSPI